jgi:hypothetical protein
VVAKATKRKTINTATIPVQTEKESGIKTINQKGTAFSEGLLDTNLGYRRIDTPCYRRYLQMDNR